MGGSAELGCGWAICPCPGVYEGVWPWRVYSEGNAAAEGLEQGREFCILRSCALNLRAVCVCVAGPPLSKELWGVKGCGDVGGAVCSHSSACCLD